MHLLNTQYPKATMFFLVVLCYCMNIISAQQLALILQRINVPIYAHILLKVN